MRKGGSRASGTVVRGRDVGIAGVGARATRAGEDPPQRLPAVPEFPELEEHGLLVGLVGEVGEGLAQAGDDARRVQAEEGVDLLLQPEGGDQRLVGVLVLDLAE